MISPPSPAPRRPSRWTWPLGIAVTAAFLLWAVHDVDLHEVLAGVRTANPLLILASAGVATLTFPLRTLRWHVLLRAPDGSPYAWRPLWDATAVGFMANNLLPARAGEFARAWVASRQLPVRFTTALASIGVERVFDGLIMLALMAAAIAAPSFPSHATLGGSSVSRVATGVALVFGAALALAFVVAVRPAPWLALIDRVAITVLPERLARRVRSLADGMIEGLAALRSPGRFAAVIGWSLVLWLVNAAAFALCFRAFHLPVPAEGALLLQGLIGFGVAIPAAPGFWGVFEYCTRLTLQFYGIGATPALAYAFTFHIAGFIPITLLGLDALSRAHLHLGDLRRATPPPEPAA
ncbi:MAG TPA: lysylphosphatidylglycerol synthase transmembrane domain-containing protein [Gemmatimonadales bacterium]|nr:lysylphosphatidylglycerol synthase transmembrane domain-containing protein [Gemmatimonadales bacterium]